MLPFKLYHHQNAFEFPVSLYSCGLHPQQALHRPIGYPTFQCMICFSGEGTFSFENHPDLKLAKGEILLLPGGIAHGYGPTGSAPWVLGYVGIDGSLVKSLVDSLRLPLLQSIAVNEHELERIGAELRALWHVDEHHLEESQRIASVKIYSLLTYLASIVHQGTASPPTRREAGAEALIRASVQFMEQHYMEDISLANIASAVGYSKQHFQRRFKQIYGMRPGQYLQRLRLLKAAQLLEVEADLPVGVIAEMVGMELNYFVRLFKREYGMTPAKYRVHHQTITAVKRTLPGEATSLQ